MRADGGHEGRGHRAGWLCALLLALSVVVSWGCEGEEPPPEKHIPGVNNARPYLYPYDFSEHGTVQGTRILESYLEAKQDAPDRRLAIWLLNRSYLDMLTRVITLSSEGEAERARELQRRIAEESGLDAEASMPAIARHLHKRLSGITGDDGIADESHAAVRLLDALINLHDPAYFGAQLEEVASSELEVATNARLLIAARGIGLFGHLKEVPLKSVLPYMVTQYPFPCPVGYVAFSQGDRSLESCAFVCEDARDAWAKTPREDRRGLLIERCGVSHYDVESVENLVYLSPENYVLQQTLLHMNDNQKSLGLTYEDTPIGALHKDFIQSYRSFITNLSLPAFVPVMSPVEGGVHLPTVTTAREPAPGMPMSVVLRGRDIRLGIANHFHVHRSRITVPERILGYTFPGRLGLDLEGPFKYDIEKLQPQSLERGVVVALRPLIQDCSADRERLDEHIGVVVPGESDPNDPFGLERDTDAVAQLLIDEQAPLEALRPLLRTLLDQSIGPFSMIVWNPGIERAGAILFDVAPSAPETPHAFVRLRRDGWTARIDGRKHRASSASYAAAMDELYTLLHGSPAWESRAIVLSPDWSLLSVTELAQAIELLSHERAFTHSRPPSNLEALLAQPASHAPRARAAVEPRVTITLE